MPRQYICCDLDSSISGGDNSFASFDSHESFVYATKGCLKRDEAKVIFCKF
jgi:hypothetical protein